ncbi:hypothetical protein RHMOL_Rhmol02G0068100 [Rhododendron molle]|uniref:Uncharacterized protein n=2 Tax=Rhododendron molle TaxID=49168 RepID=A0ACC0PNR9_RHOML|nr:hypothetical protein RHMOL_Rhmol02G0068100 [Rhododendron molle]KAI8566775.1 hypothetical protein RHMOL_Rhmol02G0068100 [Rhododendron molle]
MKKKTIGVERSGRRCLSTRNLSQNRSPAKEEVANSLDVQIRQNISSFVDAVEKILMQQTRAELQSDNNSES